ncbi:MAG TPA: DNA translocase FtsK 4TM domain-containing protein [Phycisphaerales bacterium]|nr:DNA translocase FtsK 4TM domain-containing protein [Phycisphaerales bacterium]
MSRIILLVVMIAAWAFVFFSMVGFDPADPPTHVVWPANESVTNWCGPFGAMISAAMFKTLGFGAWVLAIFTGIGLLSAAMGAGLKAVLVRLVGLVLLAISIAGLQALVFPASGSMPDLAGGLLGRLASSELALRFGGLGAGLLLCVAAIIGAIVAMDEWMLPLFSWMAEKTREHAVPAAKVVGVTTGQVAFAAGAAAARGTAKAGEGLLSRFMGAISPAKRRKRARVKLNDLGDEAIIPIAERVEDEKPAPKPKKRSQAAADEPAEEVAPLEDVIAGTDEDDEDEEVSTKRAPAAAVEDDEDDEIPAAPQVYTEDQLREKIAKLPIVFGQKSKSVATEDDMASMQAAIEEGEKYKFPGLDQLEEPEANFNELLEQTVKEQAQALIKALEQFRIEGEVDSVESGPVITLFHVRLSPGTKVSQLDAVSKDIARVLKAQNIRIVSNTAGRDTVAIEVPNLQKEKVRLKELMGKTDTHAGMKLPMFLGKDASGEPLIEDLTKMPHMLIAGTTGSGKSVCMNTIIMGFLYTKKPSELKMVLVDPKMVEMSQFKDIPHLMCPVVTEMSKAAAILEWATKKMDERYELLAEAGCRDIAAYNDLTWEELKERLSIATPEAEARTPRKLPYMVFIIDELADLIMTNKDVESHIIRIAQKARAVGIHLILATQRPQANVVTGLIKSNMPCRIAFKVASGMDSRIVLDQKGGELLLGHGDMLYLSPRSSKLTRAQGTLVDDREIRRVVKFMKEVASPSFERALVQLRSGDSDEQRIADSKNNSSASLQAAQEDPMFNRAVEIVLETKRGSVSLLQRRLAIGYTRASRLIDLMGIAGIISDHKGSVARDVLITLEDWERIKLMAAQEAREKGIELRHETEAGGAASPEDGAEGEDDAEQEPPFDVDPDNLDGDKDEPFDPRRV